MAEEILTRRSNSKNVVQFCVKVTGLSMMECVTRILGHYKTDACRCRTLDRIGAVEVAFRPEISVNDIIKKGFTLEDRQIPIYKIYNDHHNLLTVKLLDLPMQPEETFLEHIRCGFEQYAPVEEIRMEHFTVNGVKYITDNAFVRLNITDHPDVKDKLPRLFTLDDAAVNMMWKDAPLPRKQRSQQGNPEPEIRTKEISVKKPTSHIKPNNTTSEPIDIDIEIEEATEVLTFTPAISNRRQRNPHSDDNNSIAKRTRSRAAKQMEDSETFESDYEFSSASSQNVCLQETHADARVHKWWSQQWGNPCFWTQHIAILCNNPLINVERNFESEDQRILQVKISHSDLPIQPLHITCVYAPAKHRERRVFYSSFPMEIKVGHHIMTGDFNTYPDSSKDHYPPFPRNRQHNPSWKIFNDKLQTLELFDIHRHHSTNADQFTFNRSIANRLTLTRLDHAYTTPDIIPPADDTHALSTPIQTDHRALVSTIRFAPMQKQGAGVWKLNTALLAEEEYKKGIEILWQDLQSEARQGFHLFKANRLQLCSLDDIRSIL
ncbi:uncharacterized protein VTP21DRAFT_6189 [Calcarisporiella thermophila]|uniref:uncharacterized protein n=1 Tax=Calcarisporiella thermophila TaxID=911321 RepID=UPI003742921A